MNTNNLKTPTRSLFRCCIAAAIATVVCKQASAGIVTLADPLAGGISYYATVQLGVVDTATFTGLLGAWSWEDNDLGDGTGWTHTSDWVALTLNAPTTLTLRMERDTGVLVSPGVFATTEALFPSFTILSGWDNDGTNSHTYPNTSNIPWAEDITYLGHVNNSTQPFAEVSWNLPAGNYTFVLGSNAPTIDSNDQGYRASFTTVPEPGTATFLCTGLAGLMLRRRRSTH